MEKDTSATGKVPAAHTFSKSFFSLEHEPFKSVKMKVLSGSLLLWRYVNVSYILKPPAPAGGGNKRVFFKNTVHPKISPK